MHHRGGDTHSMEGEQGAGRWRRDSCSRPKVQIRFEDFTQRAPSQQGDIWVARWLRTRSLVEWRRRADRAFPSTSQEPNASLLQGLEHPDRPGPSLQVHPIYTSKHPPAMEVPQCQKYRVSTKQLGQCKSWGLRVCRDRLASTEQNYRQRRQRKNINWFKNAQSQSSKGWSDIFRLFGPPNSPKPTYSNSVCIYRAYSSPGDLNFLINIHVRGF